MGNTSPRGNLTGHLVKSGLRLTILVVADVTAVLLGRQLLRWLRSGQFGTDLSQIATQIFPQAAVPTAQLAVAIVLSLWVLGGYRSGDLWRQPVRILRGVGGGVVLALFAYAWMDHPLQVGVRGLVIWILLGSVLVVVRNGLYWGSRWIPRPGLDHRVLEVKGVGSPEAVTRLGGHYRTLAVLRVRDLPEEIEGMNGWLEGGIDTVLISGWLPDSSFVQLTDFALTHGCRLLCTPLERAVMTVEPNRVWLRGRPFSELTTPGLRASQLVIKRLVDIAGSISLLTLLGPVMLLIALAVKLDSKGPILFRHRRAGYGGRFFQLMKFRSMRCDAEEMLREDEELWRRYVDNDFKLPEEEDPRITPLGRFLRRTSLDELPQLLNVLKGDMSLVGPRPVVELELEMYRGRIPTLLSVKPGVTGLWQVSGRSNVGHPERAHLDLDYVRNWSLVRDIWILLMTIPAVLYQRGAH